MDELILKRQYSEAYEILTDLAVYDFSVIDNLQEFPQEFINSIKSCKIQFENRDLIDDDRSNLYLHENMDVQLMMQKSICK